MRLSKGHLDFYMSKKYPLPKFGNKWAETTPDINDLINYSSKMKLDYDKGNVNNFIKNKKGRELRKYLRHLITEPGTIINPKKRSAYAKRILKRLLLASALFLSCSNPAYLKLPYDEPTDMHCELNRAYVKRYLMAHPELSSVTVTGKGYIPMPRIVTINDLVED